MSSSDMFGECVPRCVSAEDSADRSVGGGASVGSADTTRHLRAAPAPIGCHTSHRWDSSDLDASCDLCGAAARFDDESRVQCQSAYDPRTDAETKPRIERKKTIAVDVREQASPSTAKRLKFTELPSDVLALVYSFGDVRAHFRTRRCAHVLSQIAALRASSPAAVVVRRTAIGADGRPPKSMLAFRPASLDVHYPCLSCLVALSVMRESVRAIDLVVDQCASPSTVTSTPDAAVWASLRQFYAVTSLTLKARLWSEIVGAIDAIGAQLETLHVDMCVAHREFDFSCLVACVRLAKLRLTDVELTTVVELRRLAECMPRLLELELDWCYATDSRSDTESPIDLAFLSDFTQLRRLAVASRYRRLALPSAMPFLEHASFETKRLATPSSFRGWSSLRSLKLPEDRLSDLQLPPTLTHLDTSAFLARDEDDIVELIAAPLRSLRRLIVNRRRMNLSFSNRPGGVIVLLDHISHSGSSLVVEWVSSPGDVRRPIGC